MSDAKREHETDAPDFADAHFLIDGGEARLGLCECCGKMICTADDWGMEPEHLRTRRPAPRLPR